MAMTQMNTRLDDALKRRGDAVFAQVGLTPSEVVRSVWEYAAQHAEVPAIVADALIRGKNEAATLDVIFRVNLAEQASEYIADYRQRMGLPVPDQLEAIDYRALQEEAWDEKLQAEEQV